MKEIKGDYIQKPNGSWTKIKSANKIKFIKKFFPKIRTFPDNTISNVFQNFERVKFNIHSKKIDYFFVAIIINRIFAQYNHLTLLIIL